MTDNSSRQAAGSATVEDVFLLSAPELRPLTVRLHTDVLDTVEALAEGAGVSKSSVIRRLVDQGIDPIGTAITVLEDLHHIAEAEETRQAIAETQEALREHRDDIPP